MNLTIVFSTYPCAFLFPIASGSIPIPGYFRVSHGTGHFGFASAAPSVEKSRLPFQRVALRAAITDRFESYRINIGNGTIWLCLPELYGNHFTRDFDNNEPITTPILQLCRFPHHLHPLLRCYILNYGFNILDDECHHGPGQGHVHPDLLEPR